MYGYNMLWFRLMCILKYIFITELKQEKINGSQDCGFRRKDEYYSEWNEMNSFQKAGHFQFPWVVSILTKSENMIKFPEVILDNFKGKMELNALKVNGVRNKDMDHEFLMSLIQYYLHMRYVSRIYIAAPLQEGLDYYHKCTGSIIGNEWIISSFIGCGFTTNYKDLIIVANGELNKVRRIIEFHYKCMKSEWKETLGSGPECASKYNRTLNSFEYGSENPGIALLRIKEPFTLDKFSSVESICLAHHPVVDQTGLIISYGYSSFLQFARFKKINRKFCGTSDNKGFHIRCFKVDTWNIKRNQCDELENGSPLVRIKENRFVLDGIVISNGSHKNCDGIEFILLEPLVKWITKVAIRQETCGKRINYKGDMEYRNNYKYIDKGMEAVDGQFPWMVSLKEDKIGSTEKLCGGVIIDNRLALTAKHCVQIHKKFFSSLELWTGGIDVESLEYSYQVRKILEASNSKGSVPCSKFFECPGEADLALVEIKKNSGFLDKPGHVPICLPFIGIESELKYFGKVGIISGWGRTASEDNPHRNNLRWERQTIGDCRATMVNSFCSFHIPNSQYGSGAMCQGDSGSPLVYYRKETGQWYLIGIASYNSYLKNESNSRLKRNNVLCGAKNAFTGYVHVEKYKRFIKYWFNSVY